MRLNLLLFFLENKRLYGSMIIAKWILTLYYGREISEENYQKLRTY